MKIQYVQLLDCIDLLCKASLIIWNEVPMQQRHRPEATNCTLHDLCDNDVAFGGMTLVFGDDFCQILLVIIKGSRNEG